MVSVTRSNKKRHRINVGAAYLAFLVINVVVVVIVNVRISARVLLLSDTATFDAKHHKKRRSSLRFDWTNLPPLTPLGKRIAESQSKCFRHKNEKSPPQLVVTKTLRFSGLGSSLHTWSQSLCHAVEYDQVLDTRQHLWNWYDKRRCPLLNESESPLSCYFGQHVSAARLCPASRVKVVNKGAFEPSDCDQLKKEFTLSGVRAAAMEWLFQNVTTLVLDEAESQMRDIFGETNSNNVTTVKIPKDLITVHIRWGDKGRENPLLPVEAYINYTKALLHPDELVGIKQPHIYLASEDPTAFLKFRSNAPPHWRVYASGPKNPDEKSSMVTLGGSSNGSAGLESIAALLISLEANRYVLATGSNWSRLINELRKNIVDPRCSNCTRMINIHDIVHGEENYGEC